MWAQKVLPFQGERQWTAGGERMLIRPTEGPRCTKTKVGAHVSGKEDNVPLLPIHLSPASPLSSRMCPQPVTQQLVRFWNSKEEAITQMGWMYLL